MNGACLVSQPLQHFLAANAMWKIQQQILIINLYNLGLIRQQRLSAMNGACLVSQAFQPFPAIKCRAAKHNNKY
jgi:hypothetical protein